MALVVFVYAAVLQKTLVETGSFDQVFHRSVYSSILFRLQHPDAFTVAKAVIETAPRLTLEVKRGTSYYLDPSEMMARFLRILGLSLTLIFSVGAIIGAMITMYSAVAHRIGEIGTLRALGFKDEPSRRPFSSNPCFLCRENEHRRVPPGNGMK